MPLKSSFNYLIDKYKLYYLSNKIRNVRSSFQDLLVAIKFRNRRFYELDLKGCQIIYDTKDHYSKKWFYLFEDGDDFSYENPIINYLENNLKPSSCFIDIGAHLGFYTCIAASLCSEGEVHAFEVDRNCENFLYKNVSINKLNNVTINFIAVSDSKEGVYIPDIKRPNNKISIFVNNFKKRFVDSTTIDDYILKNDIKPDFIKIDVEGAECKVINGMSNTLKLPSLTLLIEIHTKTLKNLGFTHNSIIDILLENDFIIYQVKNFRKDSFEKVRITGNVEFNHDTFLIAEKM